MLRKLACFCCLLHFFTLSVAAQSQSLKPRIIVLTDIAPNDIEPDDMESMIRLLAHADLYEVEGLVATTGWSNNGGLERPDLLHQAITAYEKDLPNLRQRSGQQSQLTNESTQVIGYWPSPAYLRSRTVTGSQKMGVKFLSDSNRSAGSDLIIRMADEADKRPIWILVWGGGNTVAQAIWQVQQSRTAAQLQSFLHKLRIYTITDQDRPYASYEQGGRRSRYDFSSHYWMRQHFSNDLLFIWDESAWFYQNETGKSNWDEYAAHIQQHGQLGALYPKYKWGVEGDSPSFLYLLPNGLNDPEHPGSGGWGGYFTFATSRDSITSSYTNYREISANATSRKYAERFYPAIFNNFVARMDWAKDGKGNRNPVAVIQGDKTLAPIKRSPPAGSLLTLDAAGSFDPDGDTLTYDWWVLPEAGTYEKAVLLTHSNTKTVTVKLPPGTAGKTVHIICEVTDSGTPALTAYRRIILTPVNKKKQGN